MAAPFGALENCATGAKPIQSNLYCKNTADRTQLSNNVGGEEQESLANANVKRATAVHV